MKKTINLLFVLLLSLCLFSCKSENKEEEETINDTTQELTLEELDINNVRVVDYDYGLNDNNELIFFVEFIGQQGLEAIFLFDAKNYSVFINTNGVSIDGINVAYFIVPLEFFNEKEFIVFQLVKETIILEERFNVSDIDLSKPIEQCKYSIFDSTLYDPNDESKVMNKVFDNQFSLLSNIKEIDSAYKLNKDGSIDIAYKFSAPEGYSIGAFDTRANDYSEELGNTIDGENIVAFTIPYYVYERKNMVALCIGKSDNDRQFVFIYPKAALNDTPNENKYEELVSEAKKIAAYHKNIYHEFMPEDNKIKEISFEANFDINGNLKIKYVFDCEEIREIRIFDPPNGNNFSISSGQTTKGKNTLEFTIPFDILEIINEFNICIYGPESNGDFVYIKVE